MVILSLILAAEARMGVLIEGSIGADWGSDLTDERRDMLGEISRTGGVGMSRSACWIA